MFNQLLLNGIIAGSIYAFVTLGSAVAYKFLRCYNVCHIPPSSIRFLKAIAHGR